MKDLKTMFRLEKKAFKKQKTYKNLSKSMIQIRQKKQQGGEGGLKQEDSSKRKIVILNKLKLSKDFEFIITISIRHHYIGGYNVLTIR